MFEAAGDDEGDAVMQIPAMINVHSHAFQRDLRGVGERPTDAAQDDFWSWRNEMFQAVARLDPERMKTAALRTYREMVAAGYAAVGEFHYVHHQPDGTPYPDTNAMAIAVAEAAIEAGLEIVLLPAAYHRNGWRDGADVPAGEGQIRFCDPDVDTFLERVDGLRSWAATRGSDLVHVGVAVHSVRAVPSSWIAPIAAYADEHDLVRHIHAHEQPRELAECQAEHGCSPVELLARHGFLSPRTTIIHGTHVSYRDVQLLAESRTIVGVCPLTEANLGDGFAPALRYRDAGVRMAIGSDSNVRIDPFEETRELETVARREGLSRSALLQKYGDLWGVLATNGAKSLGIQPSRQLELDPQHPAIAGLHGADLMYAIATCANQSVIVAESVREGGVPEHV
jgi:formimidoylglutamate deiminase